MRAAVFLDSNVILYAAGNVEKEAAKKAIGLRLIAETDFGTSVQVLGEFYDNARRKAKLAIPAETLADILRRLQRCPMVEETVALFGQAVAIAERYGIRYYDAAIIAAAKELHAHTVYSEDLSHGQVYDGVRVVNPFVELEAQAAPPSP
jgi:predicted nucleic acid-binding protein